MAIGQPKIRCQRFFITRNWVRVWERWPAQNEMPASPKKDLKMILNELFFIVSLVGILSSFSGFAKQIRGIENREEAVQLILNYN